jgi:hypothetical protein
MRENFTTCSQDSQSQGAGDRCEKSERNPKQELHKNLENLRKILKI